MEKDRWIQIENVLRSTLDQPPNLRPDFLTKACGDDTALRQEVQSFLDSHEDSNGFLETPALDVAARTLAAQKELVVGSLIGPYRIVKSIGAGGMGEVYLAQDTRLRRQIAVKILPSEFAADLGRVQRFEQEARAAGALNHPNILVIHDTGIDNGVPYIASEYLQGETLRDRLNRGKLPLPKALDFAIQIACGLAAAHDGGIVHRDLKPENIFITSEGRVKILDFGIAKLTESSAPQRQDLTSTGMIMGSVGYLSPEQVRGQPAVPSSDIFAFGSVLYEMLTGQRAFAKDSHAETMTAILREEPPDSDALASLPPALIRTLRHCLEKSPSERFQSARDLAFTLESISPSSPAQKVNRRLHPAWMIASVLAVATLAVTSLLLTRKPRENSPLLHFEIAIPGDPVTSSPALALSPDGNYLAFMAMGSAGRAILWTRAMNSVTPHPVTGSEDARYPFWSADSRYLAFHVGDKLKTLEIATGAQRTICTIRGIINGAWNSEGVLLVSTGSGPLLRIPLEGSDRFVPATKLDAAHGQRSHWWPAFLPDNRHFVYTANASNLHQSGIFVSSLDNSAEKLLVSGVNTNAVYVPPGFLLYSREGTLVARPFDAASLEFKGAEFSVVDKLMTYYTYAAYSASQNGTLAFRGGEQNRYQLAWFDRSGHRLGAVEQSPENKRSEGILPLSPVLSPDGAQLATVQFQPATGAYGIWIRALTRANLEFPVTTARNAEMPVWSPDGTRIAYSASPNGGARDLFTKRLDEAGHGKLVVHTETDKFPLDWSSDGKNLLFLMNDAQSRTGLWVASLIENPPPPTQVPGTPPEVKQARFSPNGHWLAYTSEQSGSSLVYIQDFPSGAMLVAISGKGATDPVWSHDGRELFYLSSQNDLMSVSIQQDNLGSLSAGAPKLLFKTLSAGVNPYTVTPDAQRFLFQIPTEGTSTPVISVMLNRFAQ